MFTRGKHIFWLQFFLILPRFVQQSHTAPGFVLRMETMPRRVAAPGRLTPQAGQG